MAIKLQSTREAAANNGVKILVYGQSGAGKTTLLGTAENDKTLIISAESGLLSLRGKDIASTTVNTIEDVEAAFEFVNSDEGKRFTWICLDSLSEIAEVVLAAEKAKVKDMRQAYGELQSQMSALIRGFRDLEGRNVVMTSKMAREKDDQTGAMLYAPSMPGVKLAQSIPYFFDEVLVLRTERTEEGDLQRYLQTAGDNQYIAKDRSSALEVFEAPNLLTIHQKITGA